MGFCQTRQREPPTVGQDSVGVIWFPAGAHARAAVWAAPSVQTNGALQS